MNKIETTLAITVLLLSLTIVGIILITEAEEMIEEPPIKDSDWECTLQEINGSKTCTYGCSEEPIYALKKCLDEDLFEPKKEHPYQHRIHDCPINYSQGIFGEWIPGKQNLVKEIDLKHVHVDNTTELVIHNHMDDQEAYLEKIE